MNLKNETFPKLTFYQGNYAEAKIHGHYRNALYSYMNPFRSKILFKQFFNEKIFISCHSSSVCDLCVGCLSVIDIGV